MEGKKELIGQATSEQVQEWKGKYGDIFTAKTDTHIGYFKKPTRQQLGYAMSQQKDPLKMTEIMIKNCHIGGSDIFITDTEHMLGAAELVENLISVKKVEVEKL